ncbi:glycoside hydrolase family 88 protein [Streptomyces sp. HUAS TT20]|uniref:glycoside hydrolase family 88 protein n=1 Tax=Streptomyces sp. HUAS TT20 TaxID=3447509 RepID=UPI0021D92F45|nr:glycoside hydrolase family 88 protein [Streptomyces sp. HUAS 15-9]UXY32241.1 glycoside hydrolase family 88 protein [Streptomyces sp. HUAS 15-9]
MTQTVAAAAQGLNPPASLRAAAERALGVAQEKVDRLVTSHGDYFPLYTEGGRWQHGKEAWTNWCEGFLGGQMWIFAEVTGDPLWRRRAEHYSLLVEDRKHDRNVHDLGFVFWPTWKRWYDLTGDAAKNDVVVTAGRTMGLRYNAAGRYLRSFLAPDSLFIDIMMNVGIVFHAAQHSGDDALLDIAHQHCRTTRRHLVRGDGSTAHEGIFDLSTGEFLRQSTQQGWRPDSSWARGQTWALYGFGTCYALTGERDYLDTAIACADHYLARTGDRLVPPNDWDEPDPRLPYESSAAAIAVSGLLQLADLVDGERAARYRGHAFAALDRLCQEDFLASHDPSWEGVLKRASYHESKGLGVDESVMWGDYFFTEALHKILGGPLTAAAVARPTA